MCLKVDRTKHWFPYMAGPKKAKRNLLVWKALRDRPRTSFEEEWIKHFPASPYHQEPYTFGVIKTSKLTLEYLRGYEVNEGLHTLDNKFSLEWAPEFSRFPAIIPKGSKYFLGAEEDVVSDSLVVFKTMEDLEAVYGKDYKLAR